MRIEGVLKSLKRSDGRGILPGERGWQGAVFLSGRFSSGFFLRDLLLRGRSFSALLKAFCFLHYLWKKIRSFRKIMRAAPPV